MYQVRRAEKKDIPDLLRLLVQVDMVHHRGRPDLFRGPATKYSGEELEALLEKEESPVFVCTDARGQVLGHGFCILQHAGGQLMQPHDTLYIDDICVEESARGKGVGEAIFRHISAYARDLGCYNITLNVWSCNPGAMRFYEKLGLQPYRVGMEMLL